MIRPGASDNALLVEEDQDRGDFGMSPALPPPQPAETPQKQEDPERLRDLLMGQDTNSNALIRFGLNLAKGRGAGFKGAMADVASAGLTSMDYMQAMRDKQISRGMARQEFELKKTDTQSRRISAVADMLKAQAELGGDLKKLLPHVARIMASDLRTSTMTEEQLVKYMVSAAAKLRDQLASQQGQPNTPSTRTAPAAVVKFKPSGELSTQ